MVTAGFDSPAGHDPPNTSRSTVMTLYTTRNEAIGREIRAVLEPSADLTGPIDQAFDIDAIAEETIVQCVTE